MKYVSLFAGIGGFDLALNRLGHECVYANDFDKYAAITYNKNFKHKIDTTSITDVPTSSIPDHDLLVGGFPCQAFSIAGKRKGFEDTRGTLFFDVARILNDKRPRYFILENVKGLLSHDNGGTFKTIIKTLDELGYDVQWQVLNSKDWGVPQNRERIYIVGHLRGEPRPQVFPLINPDQAISRDLASTTVDANYWKGIDNHGARTAIVQLNLPNHSNERVYSDIGISPTLNTMQGGMRQPFITKTVRSGGRASPHGSKQNWDSYEVDGKIRRLTPLECERLQGFPDGWTEGVSDTQRYKQLGNAVTVNVVEAVASRLL